MTDVRTKVLYELEIASSARVQGNEGKARVCARRAAGWAVATLHPDYAPTLDDGNALQALRWFQDEVELGGGLCESARRLTTRVTTDHVLPFDEDPLRDAEALIRFAFGWGPITPPEG